MALINDRTFTRGEAGEIKVGTNTFKIRVIDIRDKSVTIEREGQSAASELPLMENLLPISKDKQEVAASGLTVLRKPRRDRSQRRSCRRFSFVLSLRSITTEGYTMVSNRLL